MNLEVVLTLDHLINGGYQPLPLEQFTSFMTVEDSGSGALSSDEVTHDSSTPEEIRWQKTTISCTAPATVNVFLCFRKATRNLRVIIGTKASAAAVSEVAVRAHNRRILGLRTSSFRSPSLWA